MAEGQVRAGFEVSRFFPSPERGKKRRALPSPGGRGLRRQLIHIPMIARISADQDYR